MSWIARAAALVLLAATAGSAGAADLSPTYYTATGPMSWTGPYLGANLGYEWGKVSNNPTDPSGLAGGVQGGYLWQQGRFVFGGEGDLQFSGASDTRTPWQFSNPWFGTVRARAGYTVNNWLIYGTAGFAVGELAAETPGLQTESHTNYLYARRACYGWAQITTSDRRTGVVAFSAENRCLENAPAGSKSSGAKIDEIAADTKYIFT